MTKMVKLPAWGWSDFALAAALNLGLIQGGLMGAIAAGYIVRASNVWAVAISLFALLAWSWISWLVAINVMGKIKQGKIAP